MERFFSDPTIRGSLIRGSADPKRIWIWSGSGLIRSDPIRIDFIFYFLFLFLFIFIIFYFFIKIYTNMDRIWIFFLIRSDPIQPDPNPIRGIWIWIWIWIGVIDLDLDLD